MAAFKALFGESKSGSPKLNEITGLPSLLSALAFAATPIVAEGSMESILFDSFIFSPPSILFKNYNKQLYA
jgi:hypothetical protein